ncbi:MAG: respiratory nitrate reductase subunit gamma [Rhodobacteraceae bacterium]|nr:respiratory nitrate reductase subunit gamma [Paracoccaceae bacterium]
MISTVFAVLFYLATILLVVGVGMKVMKYARTPVPLKIVVSPAPRTKRGVVLRMFREVIFFESLFKSNKWIWIFAYLFHWGMLIVLLRHLRYFTEPVWWWVELMQPLGKLMAFVMLAGLLGLWARRIFQERIRYISNPSDHLMLALLVGIAGTGTLMTYVTRTDVIMVKSYMLGLLRFDIRELPLDPILLSHLGLVVILMIIFPISKLIHAPGLFFAPSRTQVDNAREKRHISKWARNLPPLPEGIPKKKEG